MKWWLPLLLMALITPFTPWLDMEIEKLFFEQNHNAFLSNDVTHFIFEYGPIPAYVATALAAIAYLLSFCIARLKKWRVPALIFLLTVALGAGVIVHGILKEHWGRPRPKQVIEFGGGQEFRPYYKPNFNSPEPSKSLACGHCTMGFCFFALAIGGLRIGSNFLYYLGLGLAIVLGITLSLTRMAQGGHFLSDTLMAALVMWLTALTVDWMTSKDLS